MLLSSTSMSPRRRYARLVVDDTHRRAHVCLAQRIVLQLPPLPTGLTLRARPDAPAGTVPSWSDVVPGPLGKFCVLKSGQVLYRVRAYRAM